jgi:YggT family protein
MNINPFIDLLNSLIGIYNFCLFAWIIITWLVKFDVINKYHPLVARVMMFFEQIIEPPLSYIRRFLPHIGGVDISPIALILLLQFLQNVLFVYLYKH